VDQQPIGRPVTQARQRIERGAVRRHVAETGVFNQPTQPGQPDGVVVNDADLCAAHAHIVY
jgi:hypothetical protein